MGRGWSPRPCDCSNQGQRRSKHPQDRGVPYHPPIKVTGLCGGLQRHAAAGARLWASPAHDNVPPPSPPPSQFPSPSPSLSSSPVSQMLGVVERNPWEESPALPPISALGLGSKWSGGLGGGGFVSGLMPEAYPGIWFPLNAVAASHSAILSTPNGTKPFPVHTRHSPA